MHRPPKKKRPGGGQAGEPSEAEFDRDWAAIEPFLEMQSEEEGIDEDERRTFNRAQSAELCRRMPRFLRKHRRRMEARGLDVDAKLAELADHTRNLRQKERATDRANEELLHATADLADAHTEVVKGLLQFHGALEKFTEEDWAKLAPDSRQEMWNIFMELRADAPGWLANLPIEERRRLEAGRGEPPGKE